MASNSDVVQIIKDALGEAGFSPLATSASLARFASESSFNPRARNKDDAGPGKDSIGFFQWNRDRLENLKSFAAKKGTSIFDPRTQAQFYAAEVKGQYGADEAYYGKKLLSAKTPQAAAEAAISLARPGGWSPENPSGGLGFQRTLNLTKKFAAGEFNYQGGGSDTGANTSYTAGPDRLVGPDAPSLLASISSYVDPGANAGQGVKGGQAVQGPPIPNDIFSPSGDSDSSPVDESPAKKAGDILTGFLGALGQGFEAQREKGKNLKNPLFNQAKEQGLVKPLSVAQIKSMIHV